MDFSKTLNKPFEKPWCILVILIDTDELWSKEDTGVM